MKLDEAAYARDQVRTHSSTFCHYCGGLYRLWQTSRFLFFKPLETRNGNRDRSSTLLIKFHRFISCRMITRVKESAEVSPA